MLDREVEERRIVENDYIRNKQEDSKFEMQIHRCILGLLTFMAVRANLEYVKGSADSRYEIENMQKIPPMNSSKNSQRARAYIGIANL